jgi:hypothetical protein
MGRLRGLDGLGRLLGSLLGRLLVRPLDCLVVVGRQVARTVGCRFCLEALGFGGGLGLQLARLLVHGTLQHRGSLLLRGRGRGRAAPRHHADCLG